MPPWPTAKVPWASLPSKRPRPYLSVSASSRTTIQLDVVISVSEASDTSSPPQNLLHQRAREAESDAIAPAAPAAVAPASEGRYPLPASSALLDCPKGIAIGSVGTSSG